MDRCGVKWLGQLCLKGRAQGDVMRWCNGLAV